MFTKSSLRRIQKGCFGQKRREAQPRDCRKKRKGAIIIETQSRTRTQTAEKQQNDTKQHTSFNKL